MCRKSKQGPRHEIKQGTETQLLDTEYRMTSSQKQNLEGEVITRKECSYQKVTSVWKCRSVGLELVNKVFLDPGLELVTFSE